MQVLTLSSGGCGPDPFPQESVSSCETRRRTPGCLVRPGLGLSSEEDTLELVSKDRRCLHRDGVNEGSVAGLLG